MKVVIELSIEDWDSAEGIDLVAVELFEEAANRDLDAKFTNFILNNKQTIAERHKQRCIPLTSIDPMPFGKHKGTLLKDVPPLYMLWLHEQLENKCKPAGWPLKAYIDRHIAAIRHAAQTNSQTQTKNEKNG